MITMTRLTPLANASVRIGITGPTGIFVAHGDGGTGWVRLADGNEIQALVDDLTVLPEGARVTPVACPLKAGTCTPEVCVNQSDPVAQASCKLC